VRFLDGAKAAGFDEKKAGELFELMAQFANYGFNKSHAAAYCVVAAQTAWLKKYYTVEFFAGLLSTEMSNTDNVVKYVKDAQAHGIQVEPPHVNHSEWKFTVKGNSLFFALGAIKGVGEGAVEAIIEARRSLPGGKFETLDQFFESVDFKRVNKKVIECLIKAGAFEGMGAHQAQLMQGYEKFLDRADQARKDREVGQGSLFALMDEEETKTEAVRLDDCPPWPRALKLQSEKDVLGFYLSDHPMAGLTNLIKIWTTCTVDKLISQEPDKRVVVAGLITSLREIISKKGSRMAFAQVEDLTGSVELVCFPEAFAKNEMQLKTDQPVLVGGNLKREGDSAKIMVDRVAPIEEVMRKSKHMTFKVDMSMQAKLKNLSQLLTRFPGKTGVDLEIELEDLKKTVTLGVLEPAGIDPTHAFFEDLHMIFGRTDFVEIRG
jgi:DNA polymerase-3 subunit alpha